MEKNLQDILNSDSPWSAEEETIIFSFYQKSHDPDLKNIIVKKI